ncbi:MAG: DUF2283 domain-containing protein [Acidimicrobiia bacterium]
MSITIGTTTFDRVDYDVKADVLYLHAGNPEHGVDFDESPEGHGLRYDVDEKLVGITLVNAKALIDQATPITITIPERVMIDREVLALIIQSAA